MRLLTASHRPGATFSRGILHVATKRHTFVVTIDDGAIEAGAVRQSNAQFCVKWNLVISFAR